jgi:hypothetical protein|tara:strand:- start:1488 stop:1643 length:156 start_codon:yes stop_codon:yes gene_type:complete
MFNTESTTFSIGHFFRTFTFSNKGARTEKTMTIDNKHYEGDDLTIIYENTN